MKPTISNICRHFRAAFKNKKKLNNFECPISNLAAVEPLLLRIYELVWCKSIYGFYTWVVLWMINISSTQAN